MLVIDNYDSFTYNLVHCLGVLGEEIRVCRNDQITVEQIEQMSPDFIIISSGPGTPDQAGVTLSVIEHFKGSIPILGVSLGHLAIAQAFGGEVVQAKKLIHGKTSAVMHDGRTIFGGLPSPFQAARYHSLIAARRSLPNCLEISAETNEGEIMGLRHKQYPIEGIQFHPESIISEYGQQLLSNFITVYNGSKGSLR